VVHHNHDASKGQLAHSVSYLVTAGYGEAIATLTLEQGGMVCPLINPRHSPSRYEPHTTV
jgi:hypothetical protein